MPEQIKAGKDIPMPSPTEAMLKSPEFEAVWQLIKSWDVNVPEYYEGYCGANGSHVALILRALTNPISTPHAIMAIGHLSSELADRSGAFDGEAPDWFPEPTEWLQLWEDALEATGDGETWRRNEALWGDDAEAVQVVSAALTGHHPERGGQEREQAAHAVVRALRAMGYAPPA